MSEKQAAGVPQFDLRLIELLENIRKDVLHLLRPDQRNPPAAADISIGLQTLKVAADTIWRVAEKEKLVAEKERLWAERDKIKAYTEQLKAETEKITAQKM